MSELTGLDPESTISLSLLHKGDGGIVDRVLAVDSARVGEVEGATIARRLLELGFVNGESVEVVATAWPGGDPMAVRVGAAVFALRRREAQAVLIRRPNPASP
jgi:ferrous iron transport protein A